MPPYSVKDKCFLFANVNVVPDHYDDWQAAFDKLAVYVHANEPNTLTYYFGLPLEHASNPSRTDYMFAFEAYTRKSDLYDVHLKSDVMSNVFLPNALPVMTTGLDLRHFEAVGGYLDASGEKEECGIMHDVYFRCTSDKDRLDVANALEKLCAAVEEKSRVDGKGEVVTFLGLTSMDDELGGRIFARYSSRDVFEAWIRSDLMKGFWEEFKPRIAAMEARAYIPNGKGWLWK